MTVKTGISECSSACLAITTDSVKPLARAVRTKSSPMVSIKVERNSDGEERRRRRA